MMTELMAAAALVAATPLATQSFRDEHVELHKHLEHVSGWIGSLPHQPAAEQAKTRAKITGFFREHIVPHAEWEEKYLYPLVDQKAGTTESNRLTASMRYEHRIVGTWLAALEKEKDATAFARKADQLLGLILAHFEEEEEVLLPILDRSMTVEEFNVQMKGAKH